MAQKQAVDRTVQHLEDSYNRKRDECMESFVPRLFSTVERFKKFFEDDVAAVKDLRGEAVLAEISETCASLCKRGDAVRQPKPTAENEKDLKTLMELLGMAIRAGKKLKQLMVAAGREGGPLEGVQIVSPPTPTKDIVRCMQKAHEKDGYDGDYTRILDLARISLVCDERNGMSSLEMISETLKYFANQEEMKRIQMRIVRVKDRLTRRFDAMETAGFRDILINAQLDLGGGEQLVVEIQVHLSSMHRKKREVHSLYAGSRVLKTFDEATIKFEGTLNESTLERARKGIIRMIACPYSKLTTQSRDILELVINDEPCLLVNLDISFSEISGEEIFKGWTMRRFLLGKDHDCQGCTGGTIASRYLRQLKLSAVGLRDEIPELLDQCLQLKDLWLNGNTLSGSIPSCLFLNKQNHSIGSKLRHLNISYNKLTGELPPEIGKSNLEYLNANNNKLTGGLAALRGCKTLKGVWLFDNLLSGELPETLQTLESLEYFNVENNKLEGGILDGVFKMEKLRGLYTSGNEKMKSEVPKELVHHLMCRRRQISISVGSVRAKSPSPDEWISLVEGSDGTAEVTNHDGSAVDTIFEIECCCSSTDAESDQPAHWDQVKINGKPTRGAEHWRKLQDHVIHHSSTRLKNWPA
uniref:Uncharacterized protein n=1 Tax=Haptolina ericina TaxID=156174 RepID=A0A7S3AXX8_9EUKA